MSTLQSNSKLTINDLDDDVLLIVFSYLDFLAKARIESVCKRWQSLIQYVFSTQARLCFSDKNDFDVELCCPKAIANFKWNEFIEFSEIINFDYLQLLGDDEIELWDRNAKEIIRGSLEKCTNLTSFGLIDFYRLENPLQLVVDYCSTTLEEIEFIGFRRISFPVDVCKKFGRKFPTIKTMRFISATTIIAEESLKALYEYCPNLENFILHSSVVLPPSWTDWGKLGHYQRINGDCFGLLSSKTKEISTDVRVLDNRGLLSLASSAANQLISLELKGSTWEAWWLQIICQGLRNLQKLKCSKISIFSNDDLEEVKGISLLSHLQDLSLDFWSKKFLFYLDEVLFEVMQGCQQITKLEIFNGFVTDRSLTQFGKFWPHLSYLSFTTEMNPAITDFSIPSICCLSRLEYLNLNGTNVGDNIVEVLQKCPNLRDINLEYTQVTNITVDAVIDLALLRENSKITIDLAGTDTEIDLTVVPSNLTIYL